METHCSYIPYSQTGYFSNLIIDYLKNAPQLSQFYNLPPTYEGLQKSIKQQNNFKHRKVLVETLQKQYEGLTLHEKANANIVALLDEKTFTITTAHQPNIFAGPLYVVYKIFHAIKLAGELKEKFHDYNFVPVYFMGSEDADIEELNNISINGRKYVWETKQTGAVGRMKVDKAFIQLMNEIEGQISVLPYGKELMEIYRYSYEEKDTIQQSTLKLLNNLFGSYGLLVLIPDNAGFKKVFLPVMEKEIKEKFSHKAVAATAEKMKEYYKLQAAGREVNLFYLIDDKRERIEVDGLKFKVEHLKIEWAPDEILNELAEHPERFSPNVILRGVMQEAILPNIAFIGGGGELAYWLELKEVFQQAGIPYPVLFLRNSFLLINEKQQHVIKSLGLEARDIFMNEHELMKKIVSIHTNNKFSLNGKLDKFNDLYEQLNEQATSIDATLHAHVESLKTKSLKKIDELEKKMLRAEKKKFETQQGQIEKLHAQLFPKRNLQERIENFSGYYADYGINFFEKIFIFSKGAHQQFTILVNN